MLVLLFTLLCVPHSALSTNLKDPTNEWADSSGLFIDPLEVAKLNEQVKSVLDWGVENSVITEDQRHKLLLHLEYQTSCALNGTFLAE